MTINLNPPDTYHGSGPAFGWLTFAAAVLGTAGAFNVIGGIMAIAHNTFFTHDATYVGGDLRLWGWIVLIGGVLEWFAAIAIFTGSELARWTGIVVACANVVFQLFFVPSAPLWSLCAIVLDVLVIYALAVHGGREFRMS
jgi:hypothetical protein